MTFEDYCRLSAKQTFDIFGCNWAKQYFRVLPHHLKYYEFCRMKLMFWQSITGVKFSTQFMWPYRH